MIKHDTRLTYLQLFATASIYVCFLFFAKAAIASPLDSVVERFSAVLSNGAVTGAMLGHAKTLFISLAGIQMSWNLVQLAIDGRWDMQAAVAVIVRQLVFIGFFWFFVENAVSGINLFHSIIYGFRDEANRLGGLTGTLGSIVSTGLQVAGDLLNAAWEKAPGQNVPVVGQVLGFLYMLPVVPAALIIIWCFAKIMLVALITQCKALISMTMVVYFLGFGGCQYTKDIAINAIKAVFVTAIELFVVIILVALAKELFNGFVTEVANSTEGVWNLGFQLMVAVIVFYGLVESLPHFVSGIITGSVVSGGGNAAATLGAMGTAMAAAGAAAAGGFLGGVGGAKAGGGVKGVIAGAAKGAMGSTKGAVGGTVREAGANAIRNAFGSGNSISSGGGSGASSNPYSVPAPQEEAPQDEGPSHLGSMFD